MTARLKRARARQKLGRPRKDGERYPSGQLKHSERREDTMSVAIEARMRMHGVESVIFKGRDLSGFTLGRMHLDKKISEPELEAGMWYSEVIERYYRSTGRQPLHAKAWNPLSVRGFDGDESETALERANKAAAMFTKTETALGCAGLGVKSTLWNVCVLDMDNLRLMPKSQVRLLKRGLQALFILRGIAD